MSSQFRWIALVTTLGMALASAHGQTPQISSTQIAVTGFITDTLSGRTGATALHAAGGWATLRAGEMFRGAAPFAF